MEIEEIGYIKSEFNEPANPEMMREKESRLVIKEEYSAGLDKIEEYKYLQVVFYLHQIKEYKLTGPKRVGPSRGVFASRSPHRPVPIGVTTVKLMERNDNVLRVKGLDAVDGTPLLDIKNYSKLMDTPGTIDNPRLEIEELIKNNDLKSTKEYY